MRYLIISRVGTTNLRYVIFVVDPEAAKRLGAGGATPGSPWPHRTTFGLRCDGALAWELGKIQQMWTDKSCSQVKNTIHGICQAEISISCQVFLQIDAYDCDLMDPICFYFTHSEHMSATNQENHYIAPLPDFPDRMYLPIIPSIKPLSIASIQRTVVESNLCHQRFQIQSTFKTTCFLRMSSTFGDVFYPNFKKPVPAHKIRIF